MRIGIRIPPCRPLPEVSAVVRQAEAAGFDTAAMPDSPAGLRDVMLSLAHAGTATERITLATSVTNVVTRQPVVIASGARTIAEIAPGRLRLGLGAGFTAVFLTGQRPSSTATLRAGLTEITALLRGEAIQTDRGEVRLQDPCGPIPIYLAAHGPKNLALAAELADGMITTTKNFSHKVNLLAEAAKGFHRDRALRLAVNIVTRVTDDLEREARLLKPRIFRYIQSEGASEFEQAGFTVSVPSETVPLPDGKDPGLTLDLGAAVEVASRWISDEVAVWYAQNICLYGSGQQIADRIALYGAAGVDEVIVGQASSYTLPHGLVEEIGAEVIPRIRAMEQTAPSRSE